MKKFLLNMVLFFGMLSSSSAQQPTTGNKNFDAELNTLLSFTVPLISVEELRQHLGDYKIFDAREKAEYDISHIPGAVNIGYDNFDPADFDEIKKDEPVVLYCSVGYRSEKIGERLEEMGFTHVTNLYGSIFDWANKGLPLVNKSGKRTLKIHTYNEEWSKWVSNPKLEKIW